MGYQKVSLPFIVVPIDAFKSFLLTGESIEAEFTEDDIDRTNIKLDGLRNHSVVYGIGHTFETTVTYRKREFNAQVNATVGGNNVFVKVEFDMYPQDNMSE